jgi:hypothetical protein
LTEVDKRQELDPRLRGDDGEFLGRMSSFNRQVAQKKPGAPGIFHGATHTSNLKARSHRRFSGGHRRRPRPAGGAAGAVGCCDAAAFLAGQVLSNLLVRQL